MKLQLLRKQISDSLKKVFAENELLSVQLDSVQLDVDLILCHFLKKDRTWLLFNRDFEVEETLLKEIYEAVEKRKTGFPIAYITGHKEFFGLDFNVSPDVLIPKPDTELLVELGIRNEESGIKNGSGNVRRICDMCSGSGCVGISLAWSLLNDERFNGRKMELTFVDVSEKALKITKENAERILNCEKNQEKIEIDFNFVLSNLFDNVEGKFDLIVTNPPYVPRSQSLELLKDGRSEPLLALNGDVQKNGEFSESDDGLFLIRRLVPQCYERLNHGGTVIMETGEYNAEETAELFKLAGFKDVHIEKDLNGMLRDVAGRKG
ncbi:MAG: peptide chain release factor N(5)-glutamine methyltransferase [Treponema sp.]|nr:peptide chain release factor N(5)-glutamine methyltransferase [Candidatus Treponema equifaecale]